MILHYKVLGKGKPLVILHGLFGMLDNWMSIANQLQDHYTVYLVDLRNHGKSPHADEHDYSVMAQDLLAFLDEHRLFSVYLVGHSMGGKVAMRFAQFHPEYIEKLLVVDITPKAYPFVQDVVLDALQKVDFQVSNTRKAVEQTLRKYLQEEDVIQFLLKNLYWKNEGELAWKFNLKAISTHIQNIGQATIDRVFTGPTLFIRGETSNYIKPTDEAEIEAIFPNATILTIPQCGHWVHAEKPAEFIKALTHFLV